jgi:fumarate reductase (CoM/CoB) subunit B
VIAASGVDSVLTVCAGCGKTLRRDYPPLIKQAGLEQPSWRVLDITEFLLKRLSKSAFVHQPRRRVTYHDPCHLRRGLGVFREPREVIGMIPGVELVEMEKPDLCCGAGGGVRSGDRPLSMLMAGEKAKLVGETKADAVVTVCSFCQLQLSDALEGSGVRTLNVAELLDNALR